MSEYFYRNRPKTWYCERNRAITVQYNGENTIYLIDIRTNGTVFCILSVVWVESWTKTPIYHDKCGFQMLPSPPASFSSCARRFMMDFSYTCMKHTVNYFLASSIITKSADYRLSFRSSRCLRLETFTCMSLAKNNKFIIFSLHTPAVPCFHVCFASEG